MGLWRRVSRGAPEKHITLGAFWLQTFYKDREVNRGIIGRIGRAPEDMSHYTLNLQAIAIIRPGHYKGNCQAARY